MLILFKGVVMKYIAILDLIIAGAFFFFPFIPNLKSKWLVLRLIGNRT